MIDPHASALLMIDMQLGFIDESSPLCIAGARASLPACARTLRQARSLGALVVHVRRKYSLDGSDVEAVRYFSWRDGGRPLSEVDPASLEVPAELAPTAGEPIVVKPRFSAFFGTNLDAFLRERGIATVVLIGTTTPNCVRSTCYDALSLGYNVAVIEDATSSRSPEVQAANIEDMACIGAHVLSSREFCESGFAAIRDIEAEARRDRATCAIRE